MSKARKIKALSEHRTEADALMALIEASKIIVADNKQQQFSLKIEKTGDEFIPWAVYLYERQ